MAQPVMTREMMFQRMVPVCPHCGADMDDAVVRLEDLVDAATEDGARTWRIGLDRFVAVDAGGYADRSKANVVAACPSCARCSVLAMDGLEVKLVATRTNLDERYFERVKPCPAA